MKREECVSDREHSPTFNDLVAMTKDALASEAQPTPDAPPALISELVAAVREIDEIVALFPVAGDGTQERRVVLDEAGGLALFVASIFAERRYHNAA